MAMMRAECRGSYAWAAQTGRGSRGGATQPTRTYLHRGLRVCVRRVAADASVSFIVCYCTDGGALWAPCCMYMHYCRAQQQQADGREERGAAAPTLSGLCALHLCWLATLTRQKWKWWCEFIQAVWWPDGEAVKRVGGCGDLDRDIPRQVGLCDAWRAMNANATTVNCKDSGRQGSFVSALGGARRTGPSVLPRTGQLHAALSLLQIQTCVIYTSTQGMHTVSESAAQLSPRTVHNRDKCCLRRQEACMLLECVCVYFY